MGLHFTVRASVYYSVIILDVILCKKLSLPLNSKNLDECGRCKVLVESFNHWFEKTSRGKFEGGDAAWEETKLRSYARSEIRLIEIQEGLCSELKKHQDTCYALAADAEQALEKWWFHNDPNSLDLFTWLCIETLQDCCPHNHFGSTCQKCPLDTNSKLCSGHGRCDGDGTRKGNGSCICYKGFSGRYCEECAKDFFNADLDCKPCHKACDACTGEGAEACIGCKSGWQMENNICKDINECSEPTACKSNQFCINNEGSYVCRYCERPCKTCVGGGMANCTACEPGAMLWSGVCVDSQLKDQLLSDTLKRIALYFGLVIMILFISRTSKPLASIIIVAIAYFVYFLERNARLNTVDVVLNLYF